MSIIGNCIKTGAVVKLVEYGQTFACDLFQVGNTVVIRFAPDAFDQPMAFNHPRPLTHEAYIGDQGLLDKNCGIAIVLAVYLSKVQERQSDKEAK